MHFLHRIFIYLMRLNSEWCLIYRAFIDSMQISCECKTAQYLHQNLAYLFYALGKKGCYTPGWCVFFVIISISSVREV